MIYIAATVQIEEVTGPFNTEIFTYKDTGTGSRYYTADESGSALTTNPIPIPTVDGGYSGSYWKTHLINVTVAPTTYIKDLRYYQTWSTSPYTDWALGTQGDLVIGVSSASVSLARTVSNGFPSGVYDEATGTVGSFGNFISSNHGYYISASAPLSGGMTSIDSFDSLANAFMVQSGQVVGATTGRSWCIVTQVIVGSGATQGEKTDKTATFVYSEV